MESNVKKLESNTEICILERPSNMKFAICDNDLKTMRYIKLMLYDYSNLKRLDFVVDEYSSGYELLTRSSDYSLIIINYDMNNPSGIETAKLLRYITDGQEIAFYTRFEKSVFDSFIVRPYRFFLKPVSAAVINEMLDHYLSSYSDDHPLWIKNGDDVSCLKTSDILYVEAANKFCYIVTDNKKILCKKTMARVFDVLPNSHFYKINRAYVVNMNYINGYNNDIVFLNNGDKLHITRSYYKDFKYYYHLFVKPLQP